jgi:hypothetical protein
LQNHHKEAAFNQPRRYKARYALTMDGEMAKNITLDPGEEICFQWPAMQRKNWLHMVPGLICMSKSRFFLLEHYALSADKILELPRSALVNIEYDEHIEHRNLYYVWIKISYADGEKVRFLQIRPRSVPPSPQEYIVFVEALRLFHQGELTREALLAFIDRKACAEDSGF